jgi:DNA uptake protein ComE-like DNA-binding protein
MRAWKTLAAAAALIAIMAASLAAQTDKPAALVNPNVASETELSALPHLNAALAKTVVSQRPFKNMVELNAMLAKSLAKEQLTELYRRMFIPIDLNTASREEIVLIPGVGNRMAHEFEEYRPYKQIEQFRREIGKYVDKTEVARLERYVTIPKTQ